MAKNIGPSSVFDLGEHVAGDGQKVVDKPSPEFAERTMGAEWVQLTKAGARVIHAKATPGDVIADTAVMVSGRMSPRRLGPANPDTVGKGSTWVMNRAVHL